LYRLGFWVRLAWRIFGPVRSAGQRMAPRGGLGRAEKPSGGQWFDEDGLGQLSAQGKACVADLANNIAVAGEEADNAIFTEPDFAQAIGNFG